MKKNSIVEDLEDNDILSLSDDDYESILERNFNIFKAKAAHKLREKDITVEFLKPIWEGRDSAIWYLDDIMHLYLPLINNKRYRINIYSCNSSIEYNYVSDLAKSSRIFSDKELEELAKVDNALDEILSDYYYYFGVEVEVFEDGIWEWADVFGDEEECDYQWLSSILNGQKIDYLINEIKRFDVDEEEYDRVEEEYDE